jgi:hypothetical protein
MDVLRGTRKSGLRTRGKIRAKPMHRLPGTVLAEWLLRPDGRRGRVLTIDANSTTFTSDLTVMFEKNVARARRQHKRKVASTGHVGRGN